MFKAEIGHRALSDPGQRQQQDEMQERDTIQTSQRAMVAVADHCILCFASFRKVDLQESEAR